MNRDQSPGEAGQAMELRQVRYFLAVADLLHFGRAAERLHVVQPAVSQQIRRLERELGTSLLDRNTRSVSLTPEGVVFLTHAREIIGAVDRAAEAMRNTTTTLLRVGTGSGLGDLLIRVLEELKRTRPGLNVELVRLPEPERVRGLTAGRLGAAIVRGPTADLPEALTRHEVLTESLIAAIPAAATAPRRRTVRFAELAGMPARLPGRRENPVLSGAIDVACQRAGVTVTRAPAGTAEDMLALIASGPPSWTVFYPNRARALARAAPRGVAFRRITAPAIPVTTSVIVRGGSPDAEAFMDAFRKQGETS